MAIYEPENLDRALFLMKSCKAHPVAGGNDTTFSENENYVRLSGIPGLNVIKVGENSIRIGAMTKLGEIMEDLRLPMVLRKAIATVAPIEVRNSATIGGSVAVLSKKSVLPTVLSALGASVIFRTRLIERAMPIDKFLASGKSVLSEGGMIFEITFPRDEYVLANFEAIPSPFHPFHSFCGLAAVTDGKLTDIRIRFGGITDVPVSSEDAERILCGKSVSNIKAALPHILSMYENLLDECSEDRTALPVLIGLLREFFGRM